MGRPRKLTAAGELEVLRFVVLRKRLTNRALAERYHCSEGTIRNLATGKDYRFRLKVHQANLGIPLPTRVSAADQEGIYFEASPKPDYGSVYRLTWQVPDTSPDLTTER